jgi:hypothetical protein
VSDAASVEQLELVQTPRCDFCGHLAWTLERFGHPQGCDDFTDIRNDAWRKSYQIMGPL